MARPAWRHTVAGVLLATGACTFVAGCSSVANSAANRLAGNLSTAILDQDDPELVREGLPSYLLLLDSLAESKDASPAVLGSAARLYAAYAVVFVSDGKRAATLASRARTYGSRALCVADHDACDIDSLPFPEFARQIDAMQPAVAAALMSYSIGSLAYVRTHSDDWQAIANLPRIEAALTRLLVIGDAADQAAVNTYLGILNTLRPPALGGNPEVGKAYFEKAILISQGRDLTVLVEYARGYARLVYDRDLHDRLLKQVLEADPRQPGYTLFNILAQQQATELLESANEYF